MSGQAGAITHGISKALVGIDPACRKSIKKNKLLTRDSRTVERKKYGQRKARRRFQLNYISQKKGNKFIKYVIL